MKRHILSALAITAVAAIAGPSSASVITGIDSILNAHPAAAHGRCPNVITFAGKIKVHGTIDHPTQIGYTFLRSDGATGPIHYFMITHPGETDVSTTWTLGGPGLPHYAGWQQLKAWPTAHDGGFGYSFSPKAMFTNDCK